MKRSTKRAQPAPQPTTPPAPVRWFAGTDDEVTLPLPGGHTITIKPELEAGTQAQLLDGLDTANIAVALDVYKLRGVFAYLLGWSLPVPLPTSEDGWEKLIDPEPGARYLPRHRFDVIHRAIEENQKKLKDISIVPVELKDSEDWFLAPDDQVVLDLPFGESITIRSDIAAGTHAKILAGLTVNANGRASTLELAMRTADAYIVGWTLRYPDGRPVPTGLASLRAMLVTKFSVVSRTIQAYETALEARVQNPTGSGGS